MTTKPRLPRKADFKADDHVVVARSGLGGRIIALSAAKASVAIPGGPPASIAYRDLDLVARLEGDRWTVYLGMEPIGQVADRKEAIPLRKATRVVRAAEKLAQA